MTQHFCRDSLNASAMPAGGLARWPSGHLTYRVDRAIPGGWTVDESYDIAKAWFDRWGQHFDVRGTPVRSGHGNIVISSRNLGGPQGVLAEAQLPFPGITMQHTLQMWFDTRDDFSDSQNATAPAFEVGVHELGHNLGFPHDQQPDIPSIMDPMLRRLGPDGALPDNDPAIQWGLDRYGPVTDTPTPTTPTPGDITGLCDCLQTGNLQPALGDGRLLERVRRLLEMVDKLQKLWPQIQTIIECFETLSVEEQQRRLRIVGKLAGQDAAAAVEQVLSQ